MSWQIALAIGGGLTALAVGIWAMRDTRPKHERPSAANNWRRAPMQEAAGGLRNDSLTEIDVGLGAGD